MSTSVLLAAALPAGAVAWVLCGKPGGRRHRARLLTSGGSVRPATAPMGLPAPLRIADGRRAWFADAAHRLLGPVAGRLGMEVLSLPAGVVAALLLHSPVPLLAVVPVWLLVRRWLRRRDAEREAARWRAGVIELCSVLCAELRTGRPPNSVLVEAVGECAWPAGRTGRGAVAAVLAAARFGGDVPEALRRAARIPGAEGLGWIAACWQVAMDSGAGLAGGIERTAAALRAAERQREELKAQLAGVRSTAALLAVLPVLGVVLGTVMGADPLGVLLHTPAGLGCLFLGAALEGAGLAWTARIVRGAL